MCTRGNLHRKALNYRCVIKSHERLNGGHIPNISSVTLWTVLPSYIIPVRGTRQQNKNNKLNWPIVFRSGGNLHRKALNYRYFIKSHERLNGGYIPYISSVTLWAVLPSDVIPVRGTRQQDRNNNYILSPTLFRSGEDLCRKAFRHVINNQVKLNGGHFPYLSSVTLWAVLTSDIILVRGRKFMHKSIRSHPIQFYSRLLSKRTSKWSWNGLSNQHIAKPYFSSHYSPSSPIRAEQVDKQVRTKTPCSRIGKWSPVPLGCPSDGYYLGTTLS